MSDEGGLSQLLTMGDGLPIGGLLALHAARDPGRAALIIADEQISYPELDARSTRRSRMLAAQGVRQDDFVTLALPNGAEFYETTFAVWKLGAVPNMVSHRLPDAELAAIVDLVRPRLVIGPDPARLPGQAVVTDQPLRDDAGKARRSALAAAFDSRTGASA